MHAAKGLEFDHVYVLGLTARACPAPAAARSSRSPTRCSRRTLPPDSRAAHAAEMRRLLHVAMTRARRAARARLPRAHRAAARPSSRRRSPRRRARRVGGEWEPREEELFGPAETLQSTFRLLRDELLTTVSQVGGRLGELRFDTDLDVSHAVVRYLELLKLAALHRARRPGQTVGRRRCPRSTRGCCRRRPSEQREIFETLGARRVPARRRARRALRAPRRWRPAPSRRWSRSCPAAATGWCSRASDIETYRTCPLKYKFARVFRIPQEPTINQRFGILVHQVLERYHGDDGAAHPTRPCPSCSACSRRAGGAAASATPRRSASSAPRRRRRWSATTSASRPRTAEPVWFERSFQFRLGAAPAARPRRPRRPAARRRLRADRLQDRAARRPPRSCARTCSSRSTRSARASRGSSRPPSRPTTTCSTTRRCRSSAPSRGPRLDHRHRPRGRRRDPVPGLRADAELRRRARCATTGSPARRPSANAAGASRAPALRPGLLAALAQEALELAGEHVAGRERPWVGAGLLVGGLLEPLDEGLHVGVELDRA